MKDEYDFSNAVKVTCEHSGVEFTVECEHCGCYSELKEKYDKAIALLNKQE